MDPEITYQNTLEYLYSFVDYSLTHDLRNLPDKFDLERMRAFMAQLGHPENSYPVIHVAGTKGKGSVSALCASALRAASYKTGLYTSPHLQDYAERIQLDGEPIPHSDLVRLVDLIRPFLDGGTQLTTFEITTALGFQYFASQRAQAVVVEVGLGGRLDATNIVTPIVSVITSISYDHTQVLGNTLTEIATEKAGIIKPGIPVVVAPQPQEARLTIQKIAAERGAPLIQVDTDYGFSSTAKSLDGQSLQVWSTLPGEDPGSTELFTPLLGDHQIENAVTAYAALRIASQSGLKMSREKIQNGFAAVSWPGRFEILRHTPPLVVDAAHNRDFARRLAQTLQEYFPGWPVVLVYGASEDKDIQGMLSELMEGVDEVIFTRSYHPRAIEPAALIEMVASYGKPAWVVNAVEDALEEALKIAEDQKLILVTGSIFIAAGARHSWYNRPDLMNDPG